MPGPAWSARETFALIATAVWRTAESAAFESAALGTSGIAFEALAFGPTVSASIPASFTRFGKSFAIPTSACGTACEAAFAIAGATTEAGALSKAKSWWTETTSAAFETGVARRSDRTASLSASGTARTSRTTGATHMLVNEFHEFFELVFAQLAVVVLIESLEKLFWFSSERSALSFRTSGAAFAFTFAATVGGAHFAHLFFSFGLLFGLEFAVFVCVEFFEYPLSHFGAAIFFVAILFGRLGESRKRDNAGRRQCETRDEISHSCSFRNVRRVVDSNGGACNLRSCCAGRGTEEPGRTPWPIKR